MLCVGFAGTFAASMEPFVRAELTTPCDVVVADELGIISKLADVDVLITLGFTSEMGKAATKLRLV